MREFSCALFLPQESNRQKISELFVFMSYVALKERISSKIIALCLVLSNYTALFVTFGVFYVEVSLARSA